MVPIGDSGSGKGDRLTAPPTRRQDAGEIYDFKYTYNIIPSPYTI